MTDAQPGTLCPSATGQTEDARIVGFIGRDGIVSPMVTPIPLTGAVREAAGPQPERVFRLSGRCAQEKCSNWSGESCGLIDRMIQDVHRNRMPEQTGKLPACGIRASCVWWGQSGPEACRVCKYVIYNPSR